MKENPVPSPVAPVVKVVTRFVDENGKDIVSPEEGPREPKVFRGYTFDKTTKDKNGTVLHHYKKVTTVVKQQLPNTGDMSIITSMAGVVTMGIGALARPKRKK